MISRACYVQCDHCGDPTAISTEGHKLARRYAAQEGYRRIGKEDVCPRCLKPGEKA